MTFHVDLYDGAWHKIGDGPLQNVLSISITESLDEAGPLQFTLPATDYRAATYVQQAAYCHLASSDGLDVYGNVGRDTIDATAATPTRLVNGTNLLGELLRYSMGWWCFFDNSPISSEVLPAILAPAGWTVGAVDGDLGNFYGRFDGDSCLAALIKLISQLPGKHFRMSSTLRELTVGAFGNLSAIRFTNVAQALAGQDTNPQIAIISSLQVTSDRAPVVNRIIPWGAGADDGNVNRAKVKLFHLDRADTRWANIHVMPGRRGAQTEITGYEGDKNEIYHVVNNAGFMIWPIQQILWCTDPNDLAQPIGYDAVVAGLNGINRVSVRGSGDIPDPPPNGATLIGNPQLYLEDAAAWAADPHEAVIIFNDITLTDLSGGSWAQGAMQLYNRARRYLDQHKIAQVTYALSVLRCPSALHAGDKVRVVYRGSVVRNGSAYDWIDLDEELFVIRITRTFNADGTTSATVEVSNIEFLPITDATILTDSAGQINSINRAAQ
jgi:hypothetical protein